MVSRTTPFDFHQVPGLPPGAQIYKIGGSSKWQFRYFIDGKNVRQSTRQEDKRLAFEKSKQLYNQLLLKASANDLIVGTKFRTIAKAYIKRRQQIEETGRSKKWRLREDLLKLQRDLVPYFGSMSVESITFTAIEDYLATLSPRALRANTLKKHVQTLRNVLTFAADEGMLKTLPRFPRMKTEYNARPFLDIEDYLRLRDTAYEYARDERVFPHFVKGKSVRRLKYTPHFAHFIVIHVHSFIRINDHKLLRHKHVKIREKDGRRFLEIFPPSSKTSDRSSVSNQEAVEAYEKLLTEDKARGFGRPEDFVFYPEFRKRDYALSVMRRLFLQLCKNLGLQQDERGRNRTLYSLRHTAIMLRYLYGGPLVDLVEFAGNALTSVAMLEKFYLSHARNKFKVCQIQATSELYYSKGLDVQASNSVVPKGTCRFEYLQPRNDRR